MKRIKINLYPHKRTSDKRFIQFIERYLPLVFLALIILFAVNGILFIVTIGARGFYNTLDKKWVEIRPQAGQIDALKKELVSLKEKKKMYLDLIVPKVDPAHICADIFTSLPRNIWLGEMSCNSERLSFAGYVVKLKEDYLLSIDTFIKNLQKQQYFSSVFKNIRLMSSRKTKISGREIMKFEVLCARSP